MVMSFREEGKGPLLFFLHGLLGSGDNLLGLARSLSGRYRCILPDLRNHGASPWSGPFGYAELGADILETANSLGAETFSLIGHSVGGKAAMACALLEPERVSSLVVMDVAPRVYEGEGIRLILDVLLSADTGKWKSRGDADRFLEREVKDPAVRGFLLKNLSWRNEGFSWRCNLSSIEASFSSLSLWPCAGRYSGPVLFLGGEKSNYIRDEDRPEIERFFPNSQVLTVPLAGHWVHTDNRAYVFSAIGGFLP